MGFSLCRRKILNTALPFLSREETGPRSFDGVALVHLSLRERSRLQAWVRGYRSLRKALSPSPSLRSTSPRPKSGVPDLGLPKRISGTPEIRGEVKLVETSAFPGSADAF